MNKLPLEVLETIFTYVETRNADDLELVCKRWQLLSGERLWKLRFVTKYNTILIPWLKPQTPNFRFELQTRNELIKKWKKCNKDIDITLNSGLVMVTHLDPSFGDKFKAICFDQQAGTGNIIDLETGKIRLKFHCKHHDRSMPASSVCSSRFGIIYGYFDGSIALQYLRKDGTVLGEYVESSYQHAFSISSVWVAKNRKFDKHHSNAVTWASGSLDGMVTMVGGGDGKQVIVSSSPVLCLEGTMHGTPMVEGEVFISLHKNGDIVRYKDGDGVIIASLNQTVYDEEMVLANMNIILKCHLGLFVISLDGTINKLCDGVITAFNIDRSHLNNRRLITAGFDDDTVSVWCMDTAKDDTGSSLNDVFLLYTLSNPTNHQVPSNKPPITQVAINSVILLVAGYNGLVLAFNAIDGKPLHQVNSRIPKNSLNFNQYSSDGLVPVTKLFIDPNPFNLRGVIGVKPAIQAFNLGMVNEAKPKKPKKKALVPRVSLREELHYQQEIARDIWEAEERTETLLEEYAVEDLDADEQLRLAMLLSEQSEDHNLARALEMSRVTEDDVDDDLRLALELSRADDELERAIALSLQE